MSDRTGSLSGGVLILAGLVGALTGFMATGSAHAATPDQAPLMRAIRTSDIPRIDQLLDAGADPNERLSDGSLPLAWAVEMQDPAIVRTLLNHGAVVNDRRPESNAFGPLFVACLHPEPSVLDQLLDADADVDVRGPEQIPALSACAAHAPATIVSRMLELGSAVNAVDANGQTPLMWAAAHGQVANFKLLLEAGADPARRTPGGFSALLFAIKSGSAEMARQALAASGDPAERAPDGSSLVQLAMYQQNYGFAADLIAQGAALDAYDRNGRQLLHAAVLAKQPALVQQLLTAGANVNAVTTDSTVQWRYESNFKAGSYQFPEASALYLAAADGSAEIMRALLQAGADPNAISSDGNPIALAAASSGVPAALGLALQQTESANVRNARGETPLHRVLTSARGDALAAMLQLLAAHGARPDLADQRGRTPAQIAGDVHYKGQAAFAAVFKDSLRQVGSGVNP